MSKVITAAKHAWSAKDQITRNIWLAGLGAYDKGYESASNTVTKSQSIFDELVERGRKLESDTTQTISSQKDKLASARQNASDALQGKVQCIVKNITHIDADTFDNIIDKIEQIELALAGVKNEQGQETVTEIDAVKEVIEIVETVVTEKVASVAAEVTAVVENVAEAVTEAVTQVTPIISKPALKEVSEQVAAVKPTAKKVTNRRVKKNAAKKNQ